VEGRALVGGINREGGWQSTNSVSTGRGKGKALIGCINRKGEGQITNRLYQQGGGRAEH